MLEALSRLIAGYLLLEIFREIDSWGVGCLKSGWD